MNYIEVKDKTKKFVKEYKYELLMVGAVVGSAVLGGFMGNHIFKDGYKKGFMDGAIVSFDETVKWFNEEIPETKLVEVWTKYMQEHPEKIVTVKI